MIATIDNLEARSSETALSLSDIDVAPRGPSERASMGASTVQTHGPWRWADAATRILSCVDLKENWDSYGAKPVPYWIADEAVSLLWQMERLPLPSPSVAPGALGTVSLGWYLKSFDLEIEVLGPSRYHVAYEDRRAGRQLEGEFDVRADIAPLLKLASELSP